MKFRNDLPLVFAKNGSGKLLVLPAGTIFDTIGTDSNQLYVKLSKEQDVSAEEIQKFSQFIADSCSNKVRPPSEFESLINIVSEDTITIPVLHANLV